MVVQNGPDGLRATGVFPGGESASAVSFTTTCLKHGKTKADELLFLKSADEKSPAALKTTFNLKH